jgi:hypothetical protein
MMLLFQHNNLKASEWVGIRRELYQALEKVDQTRMATASDSVAFANDIKISTVQTGLFAVALRISEFYRPDTATAQSSDGETTFKHALSKDAHDVVANKKLRHPIEPLLMGPVAVVSFPDILPQHLKAVLSILAPSKPDFPAPSRRTNPGYHDAAVQNGLQKLLLLGARVEGRVFDTDGTKWVGGLESGLDGLRAQMVAMLQGIGAGLTNTLESTGKSLYFTVEGRRIMLEEGKENAKEPQTKEA